MYKLHYSIHVQANELTKLTHSIIIAEGLLRAIGIATKRRKCLTTLLKYPSYYPNIETMIQSLFQQLPGMYEYTTLQCRVGAPAPGRAMGKVTGNSQIEMNLSQYAD